MTFEEYEAYKKPRLTEAYKKKDLVDLWITKHPEVKDMGEDELDSYLNGDAWNSFNTDEFRGLTDKNFTKQEFKNIAKFSLQTKEAEDDARNGARYNKKEEIDQYNKAAKDAPSVYDRYTDEEMEGYTASQEFSDFNEEFSDYDVKVGGNSLYDELEDAIKDIILRRTDKRHLIIFGDPGVGKTYTAMETVKKYGNQSPTAAKMTYISGSIGTGKLGVIAWFYKHSQNEVCILDDLDTMLMDGNSQELANLMKAMLDPKAGDEKPVNVPVANIPMLSKLLKQLKDSAHIKIDMDRLKENRLVIYVNGEERLNEMLSQKEAQEFSNAVRQPTLKERAYLDARLGLKKKLTENILDDLSDFDSDDFSEEEEGILNGTASAAAAAAMAANDSYDFPAEFFFDSSCIFISNLEEREIMPAVLDRCSQIPFHLTLQQYLDRLEEILPTLGKNTKFSSIDDDIRDWAKKNTYMGMQIVIEAFRARQPLFKKPVNIVNKFTFRSFTEYFSKFCSRAFSASERGTYGTIGSLTDPDYRDSISRKLLVDLISKDIIPSCSKLKTRKIG